MIFDAIRRSISRKFLFAMLLTTCAALLVSGSAMLLYDVQVYRTTWVSDLTTMSDILARVTTPALEFNDPQGAQQNLAQLRARPNMTSGAIYTADGRIFARYIAPENPTIQFPEAPGAEGYDIKGGRITVFRRIVRDGETIGTIYLSGEYPLIERIGRYALILVLVMLSSLGVATLVSLWLNAAVTQPIVAVTDAVNLVIQRRDFSMRVRKSTEDEIGVLVDAFNSMLAEVGDRARAIEASNAALQRSMAKRLEADEALRELNNTLEARIEARTTELERAHEQLRHSQKMEAIGQLTGGVAHDFNNVLQVIAGNLQLLQLSLSGDPQSRKRLETASFAADRGAKLASQLLAFARRQPLQPVPTNLGRVVQAMDDLLRRALGEAIDIDMVVAPGLWNTLVDPNQIENVILNLAINARDAMANGGLLMLELANATLDESYVTHDPDLVPGEYVMLGIADNGCGMSQETLARAFEPFFTTKREGEGTGLGLSMAYGFVKQSNGHIRIDSAIGQGTAIRIYLPRADEPEVNRRGNAEEPVAGGSETILVVEDDPSVRATVVDILTGLGYEVIMAGDADAALVILRSGVAIDLLFTDVVMPGLLRSPELAKRARLLLPDIAVLFTSGYTQDAIVHGGRLDPGLELLSKPYRREDLARKIRELLGNWEAGGAVPPVASGDALPKPDSSSAPARMPFSVPAAGVSHAASRVSDQPSDEVPALPQAERSLHILVVEDNADANCMICELLMLLGHRVQGVADAETALTVLADTRFDVLFTDVTLPGMSGVELAKTVRRTGPGPAIIFSSGHGAVDTRGFGFDAVSLPKPYDLEKLQDILRSVCAAG